MRESWTLSSRIALFASYQGRGDPHVPKDWDSGFVPPGKTSDEGLRPAFEAYRNRPLGPIPPIDMETDNGAKAPVPAA